MLRGEPKTKPMTLRLQVNPQSKHHVLKKQKLSAVRKKSCNSRTSLWSVLFTCVQYPRINKLLYWSWTMSILISMYCIKVQTFFHVYCIKVQTFFYVDTFFGNKKKIARVTASAWYRSSFSRETNCPKCKCFSIYAESNDLACKRYIKLRLFK